MPDLTPYPDVNRVLALLLEHVQEVLGAEFVGLYVYGSLALDDFTPGRSDIDFMVVTENDLPEDTLPALRAMHARLTALGDSDSRFAWAAKLEGPYIPRDALRRYDPARSLHPALRVDGSFDVDGHGPDWIIQRYVIREYGITVSGPEPHTLIDPVTPDDLRCAVGGNLRSWWEPMLTRIYRLREPEYQAYAVLTMCRALYTLERGDVAGKAAAAQWAGAQLGDRWHALIARALAWREGMPLDAFEDVCALIRLTLERLPDSAV